MTVKKSGPVFDGRFPRFTGEFGQGTVVEIVKRGEQSFKSNLKFSLRNPTGYYESQVMVKVDKFRAELSDSGVIYGPWLEGGRFDTRFRGYTSFRRAIQKTEQQVPKIVQRNMTKYLRKIG